MPVVSNSSPLIWLAKAGLLDLLRELGEVHIPRSVYEEVVVRGLELGFGDALVVKQAVNEGWIRVVDLDRDMEVIADLVSDGANELHKGEAEALSLARSTGNMFIADDSSARALASAFGVKARGTLYVLLLGLRKGLISQKEAKDGLSNMVSLGMRIDPKLLTRIMSEIEKK